VTRSFAAGMAYGFAEMLTSSGGRILRRLFGRSCMKGGVIFASAKISPLCWYGYGNIPFTDCPARAGKTSVGSGMISNFARSTGIAYYLCASEDELASWPHGMCIALRHL
jgi:hypothetical protein